jgi:hypothetical protein
MRRNWLSLGLLLVLLTAAGCSLFGGGDDDDADEAAPVPDGAVLLDVQSVVAGDGTLALEIIFPEGWHINVDAPPFEATWTVDGSVVQMDEADQAMSVASPAFPLSVPVTLAEGEANVLVDVVVYYCDDAQTLCTRDLLTLIAPVTVEDGAGEDVARLAYTVVPPELDSP